MGKTSAQLRQACFPTPRVISASLSVWIQGMSIETLQGTQNMNEDNHAGSKLAAESDQSASLENGEKPIMEENVEKPKSTYPKRSRIPCRFFLSGFCKYAEECIFSHVTTCKYFLQGACKFGDKCRYAHNTAFFFPGYYDNGIEGNYVDGLDQNGAGIEADSPATDSAIDTTSSSGFFDDISPSYDSYYYETYANSYLSIALYPYESQYYKASGVLPLRIVSDPQRGGIRRVLALMSGERRRESPNSSKRRLYLNFLGGLRSPRDVDSAMTAGRECCQRIATATTAAATKISVNQFLPNATPESIAEALRTPPRLHAADSVELPHIYWFRSGKYVLYLWVPTDTDSGKSGTAKAASPTNGHTPSSPPKNSYENSLHWVDVDVLMDAIKTTAGACVMVRTEDGALVEVFDLVKGALQEPQLFTYLKDYLCHQLKK